MTPTATVRPASLELPLRRPGSLSAVLELSAATAGEVNPATLARGVAEGAVALPRTDATAVYGRNDSGLVLEARFLRHGRISYRNRFAETRYGWSSAQVPDRAPTGVQWVARAG